VTNYTKQLDLSNCNHNSTIRSQFSGLVFVIQSQEERARVS